MNMMEKGAEFLAKKRAALLSEPVRYDRINAEPVELSACRGSTLFRCTDRSGISTCTRTVDFIVANPGFLPKRGDRITARGEVYEVLSVNGEQVYRFSDHAGTSIRIHTKLIKSADGKGI